jgi:hypothetical protein
LAGLHDARVVGGGSVSEQPGEPSANLGPGRGGGSGGTSTPTE